MIIEEKSGCTRSPTPCDPKNGKITKIDISIERNGSHKYNTRSITKKVNHVTIFKTAPNMFKTDAAGKITTHKGTDYLAHTEPKKYIIIL